MSIYIVQKRTYSEYELAQLYFEKHKTKEAATTKTIEAWASRHFKSTIKKVAEVQPMN